MVSAFFILIEASNNKVKNYLDFITEKLNKYINNKTCVIFGINMLFKEDCTIDGDNLREYASEKNMMFIPMKINNFDLKNNLIINLLNLILIKGIDNKMSKESLRKESKEKRLGGFKNKLTDRINKDSSKKNNSNHSINKLSSKTKAKSNDNNSQESIGKEKLMNSSAKYIRTQHKLIKNNHQLAFNQSMEMPRKTYIFQNRIYHSRSKKIDNENNLNSNRSQHLYNMTKNKNHPLNNDNIDQIKEDNKYRGSK
jgi:hypothetical protein